MLKILISLTLLTASHLRAEGNSPLIIDVRTKGEWSSGHLQSAVHLPLDKFAINITSLVKDKQKSVYLYCRSGNRSGKAHQIMQNLGYTNATNAGGIDKASQLLEIKIVQ